MPTTNTLLDARLAESGMSHQGFASRINTAGAALGLRLQYDHRSVGRWLRGERPRARVQDLICDILGARLGRTVTPTDLGFETTAEDGATSLNEFVNTSTALWRADHLRHSDVRNSSILIGMRSVAPVWQWENPPEDRDVGHRGLVSVGARDVQLLRDARSHYETMYRQAGGLTTHGRVVSFLNTHAASLLTGTYSDRLGRQLHRTAGGLVALAGICAYDSDYQGLAQRYFHQALRLAKSSADRAFGAYVLALLVNQSVSLGDYRQAVAFAESGLRSAGDQISKALAADLHAMQAKAYARMGNSSAAYAAMGLAEHAGSNIRRNEEPPETDYVQAGFVETQLAAALISIGDLKPAEQYAHEAVRTATHARGTVNRLATMTTFALRSGDAERASETAISMVERAVGMESERLRERFGTIRMALAALGSSTTEDAVTRLDRALSLSG